MDMKSGAYKEFKVFACVVIVIAVILAAMGAPMGWFFSLLGL
jgi:hypothetical protein